ncbi:uncharacterized protein SCHCODRAFT_02742766 [Schizophyllum commune H4-8]|uniref:SWI5-dependent HO expression protein 3 n=1 Tax=Schizophyllum commune (strain H4-8 / FGSC 9210) TaxID=578458 RepID=D8PX27_SCHCM|nr:uncharacterized protein SCHCODRAFT_02742766 [Schizophyllum commune H4-8]KAI5899714.1 hypothetical protein SCHCODRAFT_02742766 [Schizophyllum commune H4-8]
MQSYISVSSGSPGLISLPLTPNPTANIRAEQSLGLRLLNAPWRARNAFQTPPPSPPIRSQAPSPSRSPKRSREVEDSESEDVENPPTPSKRARSDDGDVVPVRIERVPTHELPNNNRPTNGLPTNVTELQTLLRFAYAENATLKATNLILAERTVKTTSDLDSAERRAAAAEAARAQVARQLQEAQEELQDAEEALEEETERADDAKEDAKLSEIEANQAWNMAEDLERRLDMAKSQLEDAQLEVENMRHELKDMEEWQEDTQWEADERWNALRDLDETRARLNETRARLTEAEAAKEELQELVESLLEGWADEYVSRHCLCDDRYDTLQERLAAAQKDVAELRAERAALGIRTARDMAISALLC